MMDMDVLGYVAATLTTCAFLPQAWKTLRSRETGGISFWMYLIFTIGVGLWLAYGVALGSLPVIFANAVTLPLAVLILALKVRHG